MSQYRVLINDRTVNILLAAAHQGITNSMSGIETLAISVTTPAGELVIESNVKENAAAPICSVYLRTASGDPNAGPDIQPIFTMDKPDENGHMLRYIEPNAP